jgi:putative ABC transport system substrate-binding protein
VRRRDFITLLGGAAAWPPAARAQQSTTPVVGILNSRSPNDDMTLFAAFRRSLEEMGFVEGKNVVIEYRWPQSGSDEYPALMADLVHGGAAVIAAIGDFAALAAAAARTAVPVVFVSGVDPVEYGIVPSLNRPGGNMTGVTTLNAELVPKRLELLHELLPTVGHVAFLVANGPTAETLSRDLQAAASRLGLRASILQAGTETDLAAVFPAVKQIGAGGLVIGTGGLFNRRSVQIAELALGHAVPTIYQYREFAAAGGLMSYGGSLIESVRLIGLYAGRVLKGEKPAGLPVQQSTKVELIINLKTAKSLGITFPLTLLGRADEVIE